MISIVCLCYSHLMSIIVSAPGKLVLMGEHAVVYGQPCLVTSVSQRFFLQAQPTETVTLTLNAPQLGVNEYRKSLLQLGEGQVPKEVAFVEHAVRRTLQNRHLPHGVHIRTHSDFSALYGFGSSSAAAVCAVEAMSQLYGLGLPKEEVFAIAFAAVQDVQKTGSGVDIAAATFGGTLVYEIGGKRLEPIAFPVEEMLVGYTGIKADTVTVLKEVKARSERHPDIFDDIYERMGALVHRYVEEVPDLTLPTVGELMDINQRWLEA